MLNALASLQSTKGPDRLPRVRAFFYLPSIMHQALSVSRKPQGPADHGLGHPLLAIVQNAVDGLLSLDDFPATVQGQRKDATVETLRTAPIVDQVAWHVVGVGLHLDIPVAMDAQPLDRRVARDDDFAQVVVVPLLVLAPALKVIIAADIQQVALALPPKRSLPIQTCVDRHDAVIAPSQRQAFQKLGVAPERLGVQGRRHRYQLGRSDAQLIRQLVAGLLPPFRIAVTILLGGLDPQFVVIAQQGHIPATRDPVHQDVQHPQRVQHVGLGMVAKVPLGLAVNVVADKHDFILTNHGVRQQDLQVVRRRMNVPNKGNFRHNIHFVSLVYPPLYRLIMVKQSLI